MEEYDAPGLLVATTNIENSLDEALFRRFDDVFAVPLPGKIEIEQLLSLTLSGVERAKDICWAEIVAKLNGVSAAYVVRVAQSAAKSAVLSGKRVVEQSHFEAAISELKLPPSD
jgi:SpoVK/Ycf46/Vps4 family AAA+-type ATPase